ncbi:MAG: methyltransferase domain-containing protein [Methanomassiliicoccales archaeon]|jgi:ubiquinone/menaquinone biosynthesis C-methylase UbiE
MSDVTLDTPELAHNYDRISEAQFLLGRSLIEKMGVKEGEAWLDIGCGTGRLTLKVSEMVGPSGSVVGLDPSPHRIKIANEKLSNHQYTNVKFMVGVGEDLGVFPEATFDGAYFSSVFHWFLEKEKALAEAYRVLKPGGWIGITMPAPDGLSKVIRTATLKVISRPPYADHVKGSSRRSMLITRERLELLFGQTQFIDLEVEVKERRLFQHSASELMEFYSASAFGNFLSFMPEGIRDDLKQEIVKELKKEITVDGIELVSRTIFAVAKKSC